MKTEIKQAFKLAFLLFFALMFVAALWQIEISFINQLNGWDFKLIFNLLTFKDQWAVRDFWFLVLFVCFIGEAITASIKV